MSDERVRELERRGRGGRTLEDVVRLGRARLRAGLLDEAGVSYVERLTRGELDLARVELHAYLGEPTALELLDFEAVTHAAFVGEEAAVHVVLRDPVTFGDLEAWLPGLEAWGPNLVRDACAAVAEALLERLPRHFSEHVIAGDWEAAAYLRLDLLMVEKVRQRLADERLGRPLSLAGLGRFDPYTQAIGPWLGPAEAVLLRGVRGSSCGGFFDPVRGLPFSPEAARAVIVARLG